MIYSKKPLTIEAQADLLLQRGLVADRALLIERLGQVNYYRLSGYWYPFRQPDPRLAHHSLDQFRNGTQFDLIWNLYVFDRRLRLMLMDAIERIEIAVRSQLSYHHAHSHGPFGYATDAQSLPKLTPAEIADFLSRVQEETKKSRETFVGHFQSKYGDHHQHLPVWMATETMTFGSVLKLFNGSSHKVKQGVASVFGMPDKVFASWLLCLNTVRNICAHHGRLWNREFGLKPFIPLLAEYPDWHTPVKVVGGRMFAVLTICRYGLSRIAPQSQWATRFAALIAASPFVPLRRMGFPDNWRQSAIWRLSTH